MASLCEFVGSYPWGMLSDRIGRRPVLLMGLVASSVAIPLFGFSSSFPMALVARSLRGLCNANTGVSKTYLTEITDSTNRTRAFGILVTCFGVGMLVGPALGGALSNPAQSFPALFPQGSLFDRFPFALPCCVCGVCSAAASILAFWCLDETLASARQRKLREPLLSPVDAGALEHGAERQEGVSPELSRSRAPGAGITAQTWLAAVEYALVALAVAVVQEVWVLWAKLPEDRGGLLWKTARIGLVQAIGGAGILLAQLVLFPAIVGRCGLLATFRLSWVAPVVLWLATPFVRVLEGAQAGDTPTLVYVLGASQLTASIFISMLFTSTMLFISNSAPPEALGSANGVGQSLACAARSAGPIVGGSMVSVLAGRPAPIDEHLAFAVCSLLGLVSFGLSFAMPPSLNRACTPETGAVTRRTPDGRRVEEGARGPPLAVSVAADGPATPDSSTGTL